MFENFVNRQVEGSLSRLESQIVQAAIQAAGNTDTTSWHGNGPYHSAYYAAYLSWRYHKPVFWGVMFSDEEYNM